MKALVRTLLALALLSAAPAASLANEDEAWQLVTINGADAGYIRIVTQEVDGDGRTLFETTTESLFRIKRMGKTLEIGQTLIVREDEAGQIREIESISSMAKAKEIRRGVVRGERLDFTIELSRG